MEKATPARRRAQQLKSTFSEVGANVHAVTQHYVAKHPQGVALGAVTVAAANWLVSIYQGRRRRRALQKLQAANNALAKEKQKLEKEVTEHAKDLQILQRKVGASNHGHSSATSEVQGEIQALKVAVQGVEQLRFKFEKQLAFEEENKKLQRKLSNAQRVKTQMEAEIKELQTSLKERDFEIRTMKQRTVERIAAGELQPAGLQTPRSMLRGSNRTPPNVRSVAKENTPIKRNVLNAMSPCRAYGSPTGIPRPSPRCDLLSMSVDSPLSKIPKLPLGNIK